MPLYLSMLIHAKTKSRDLIDTLFNLGLGVSYDRLMNISTELANIVCAQYHVDQVVCPPQLSKDVFTCGAIDNIDHNPSARTAHDSFHGTAITLTQFPNSDLHSKNQVWVPPNITKQRKISQLPQKYTLVAPVTATSDPVVPKKCVTSTLDHCSINEDIQKEWAWLSQLKKLVNEKKLGDNDYLSWAAYHADTSTFSFHDAPAEPSVAYLRFQCSIRSSGTPKCYSRYP